MIFSHIQFGIGFKYRYKYLKDKSNIIIASFSASRHQ